MRGLDVLGGYGVEDVLEGLLAWSMLRDNLFLPGVGSFASSMWTRKRGWGLCVARTIVPRGVEVAKRNPKLVKQPLQAISIRQPQRMLRSLDCIDDINRAKINTNPRKGFELPVPAMADEDDIGVQSHGSQSPSELSERRHGLKRPEQEFIRFPSSKFGRPDDEMVGFDRRSFRFRGWRPRDGCL